MPWMFQSLNKISLSVWVNVWSEKINQNIIWLNPKNTQLRTENIDQWCKYQPTLHEVSKVQYLNWPWK